MSGLERTVTVRHRYTPDEATIAEVDRIFHGLIAEDKAPAYVYGIFDRHGLMHCGHGRSVPRPDHGAQAVGANHSVYAADSTGAVDTGDATDGGGADGATVALNEHTRFRIASMSKSFAAAAVMQLAWQGLIDLHAPASDYVPGLRHVQPYREDAFPITVHDLLAMSCGLATDDAWADRQESISRDELRSLLAQRLKSIYAPGERYEYSNIGYAAVGELIRNVSGTDVPDYVRTHLLEPLELHETTYDWREVSPSALVCGYHFDPETKSWVAEPFADPGAFSVIGGVISSVHDVAAWDAWLARGFEDERSTDDEVLPKRYRHLMQMPHTPMPPVLRSGSSRGWLTKRDFNEIEAYGYGLIIEHDERFGDIAYHSGGYPGYGSNMRWHLDSGLGVVVLANGRYATPSVLAIRALSMLLEEASRKGLVAGWSFPLWAETRKAQRRVNAMLGGLVEDAATAGADGHAGERGGECANDHADARDTADEHAIAADAADAETCARAIASLSDILAMNVTMDWTFEERGAQLARLLKDTGLPVSSIPAADADNDEVKGDEAAEKADGGADYLASDRLTSTHCTTASLTTVHLTATDEHADSPAQLSWTVPCERHPLRCTIQLNSLEHPQVQTLEFARADAPRTDDIVTVTPGTRILR